MHMYHIEEHINIYLQFALSLQILQFLFEVIFVMNVSPNTNVVEAAQALQFSDVKYYEMQKRTTLHILYICTCIYEYALTIQNSARR